MFRLICLLLALNGLMAASAPGISMPPGRIAITHDGNQHDPDDIGALPMNAVLLWAAGLTGRLVHLEHSNHLGSNSSTMEQKMKDSAAGSVTRFGIPSARIFNAQSQLSASIANFKAEAEKSSASDPLWFICSGPMETAWRCLNAVAADKRQYIRCVSHSTWNENHADTTQMTHTWASMKASFPTVIFYDLVDQNGADGDNDWNTPRDQWYWLRDSSYEPYRWVFSRDQFTTKFDPSDAGMTWWVISGGPNGGDQRAGWPEAKALLDWKLAGLIGTNQAPIVSAGPDRSIVLGTSASLDGTVTDDGLPGSSAVTVAWSTVSGPGSVIFASATAVDTSATFSTAGTYVLRLTASDTALSASDEVTVTVGSVSTMAVTSFTLINADTDQPVPGFEMVPNGAVIATDALGTTRLNLRANTSGTVKSVVFALDANAKYRTESTAPWALAGDTAGDYKAWSLSNGTHTVKATPWSATAGAGTAGTALSITFTLTTAVPSGSG